MKGKYLLQAASKYAKKLHSPYITNSLKKAGALQALERILFFGRTENGEKLRVSKWFSQQIRLTADNRLRHVLTTGASQVSKSLVNYLVAIDDLINGQINIAWVYASRQSMINQQPMQFQAMVKAWKQELTCERDSISRFKVGMAIANFSYANSSSQEKDGGAAEGKEQNSFQASKLYLEEKSSWKKLVDMSPRLGSSRLQAKPIREIGTPGNGTGIEKGIRDASHNFEPGLICPYCRHLSWLHPLGNLIKSKVTLDGLQYFDTRGAIFDFWGTEKNPFVACSVCQGDITEHIANAELYSRQTQDSVDTFLDNLPEDTVYYPSVSIYLSPLLMVPYDPYRLYDLIREGLEPDNALIYHQNKLGIESKFSVSGISFADYDKVLSLQPYKIDKPIRIVGIDQGTDTHYLVELEVNPKVTLETNISGIVAIGEDEILPYLQRRKIDFAMIDNEPGRKSANDLSIASGSILVLADQRSIITDLSPIKVSYGKIEIDCWAINNTIFKEEIFLSFIDCNYRISCQPHRKFQKHITSIKRDIGTGDFIRPNDKDDDFFFALMFAEAAKSLYFKNFKNPSISASVGKKLENYKYGYHKR